MKRSPIILIIPIAAKSLSIVTSSHLISLLSINHYFVFFDSLIYAPVYEEIFYRWLFYAILVKYSGVFIASVVISFIFAYGHDYSVVGTIGSFCSGLALQYLYIAYRSIFVCILSHALINASSLLGTYFHDQALADALPECIVESTTAHGLDPDFVEAMSFA